MRGTGDTTGRMTRRRVLQAGGTAAAGFLLAGGLPGAARGQRPGPGDPFSLGVASGDPTPDGVVLWTRLAPDPLAGGGMPEVPAEVRWEVAEDERFRRVVARGAERALPEEAHSVHVELRGLRPERPYWYRFRAGADESPVGRTRTAPRPGAVAPRLQFAFVSCQNYPVGLYPAYRDIAEQDLDLVAHLGDYIYEGPGGEGALRPHLPNAEIVTLADYRTRHAQYKTDGDLQAAHAACPWLVTWDDHEVENNYATLESDPDSPPEEFAVRRAAAYQAYWEHMPISRRRRPRGPDLPLYRRIAWGRLATFNVLDTRQYRSDQPAACLPEQRTSSGYCPEALDPSRTILGAEQRAWLLDELARPRAQWNVLAQQVPVAPIDQDDDPARRAFGGDKWDGYVADREALIETIATHGTRNVVVITGDVHVNQVRNVPGDLVDFAAPPVATEFVGTSVTSGGDRPLATRGADDPQNPHILFRDNHHGYVRCAVDRSGWRTDFRVVPTVLDRAAPAGTLATFVVEDGRAGAQADGPPAA
jgi:alkaline phosphatase D